MIRALFGQSTDVGMLRSGLNETSAVHRRISDRVSFAQTPLVTDDPEATEAGADANGSADLQDDMVALANNAVRYNATARLLHGAYAKLRIAMTE